MAASPIVVIVIPTMVISQVDRLLYLCTQKIGDGCWFYNQHTLFSECELNLVTQKSGTTLDFIKIKSINNIIKIIGDLKDGKFQ